MTIAPDEPPILTRAAFDRLKTELDGLTGAGRKQMAERLLRARELGDLRENAEYDAAKDEQGLMEARIRKLDWMTRHAQVIDTPASADEIGPGMLATLRMTGDPDHEVYLVAASSEERARGARTVSVKSPLGQALLGKRVGETVTYEAPGGSFTYEVMSLAPWDGAAG